jgi:hypothetical protein
MKNYLIIFSVLCFLFVSCEKGPGEGGRTSIVGKVWAEEWDDISYTVHYDSLDRWAADEDVFIIYGDDVSFGERIRTGPDGVFEFKYLREGDYTIYVYSEAVENVSSTAGGKVAVSKRVSIPRKGTFDAGVFTIKK